MKKWPLFLIAFLICVAFCPLLAHAETKSGACGDNLTWTLDDEGLLTISGTGEMYNYTRGYQLAPWGEMSSRSYLMTASLKLVTGLSMIASI